MHKKWRPLCGPARSEMLTPPDYSIADLEPFAPLDILHQQGALVVRQVWPVQLFQDWLPRFQAAFDKSDYTFVTGQMPPEQYEGFYRYGHVSPVDLPERASWHEQLFAQSEFQWLLRQLFGPQLCLLAKNSLPRRQRAQFPERAIAFHQDYEFTGPLPSGVNCWIPLTPAGGDYPGLELWLAGPQRPLFHLSQATAEREALTRQIPPEQLWRPCLQAGDLLLLSFFTVHRTSLHAEMRQERISYELRLISDKDRHLTRSPLIERDL